jgi:quercetin dioxygenase-like cupin family protein
MLYTELKDRETRQKDYSGRLILKSDELNWEISPQGRNAPLVDSKLTGIDCRTFGMVLTEVPPGGQSGLHFHSFEAAAYVLAGEGYEIIGDEVVHWEAGDTFYMPPNIPHRHVNKSKDHVARLLQVEAWPIMEHLRGLNMQQIEQGSLTPDAVR